jgi:C2 domain
MKPWAIVGGAVILAGAGISTAIIMRPVPTFVGATDKTPVHAVVGSTTAPTQSPPPPPPPPPPPSWYRITVSGGRVNPQRADGQPWDSKPTEDNGISTVATLAGLFDPVAATILGVVDTLDKSSRAPADEDPTLPDPVVVIGFGTAGRTVKTPVARDTTNPAWNYPFQYDEWLDGAFGLWHVEINDADSGGKSDPIGSDDIDASGLKSRKIVRLGPIGDAPELRLKIERIDPRDQAVEIEVDAASQHLVATPIAVLQGQPISIRWLEGEICVSATLCDIGPNGRRDNEYGTRIDGFGDVPNGALVAETVMPGSKSVTSRFPVGESGFAGRAPGSGILVLAVNDATPGDNKGAFRVSVETGPKMSQALAEAPLRAQYEEAVKQQSWAVALDVGSTLLQSRPTDALLLCDAGFFLYKLGKYQDALGMLERCRQADPHRRVLYNTLGNVYEALGNRREAIVAYRRFLELSAGKSKRGVRAAADHLRTLEGQGG